MNEDEVIEITNAAISYLNNARSAVDSKNYQKAISFLDAAAVEIEALIEAAQQDVQSDACHVCKGEGVISKDLFNLTCAVCGGTGKRR